MNRLLWPRLQALGFGLRFPEGGSRWKEGSIVARSGLHGREQVLLMGRAKFGHSFGLNVCRKRPDGSYEWLDLKSVGVPHASLEYATREELDAVLQRLAKVVEAAIVPWLDEPLPDEAQ